jgi:lipoic acid synthetase
MLKNRGHAQSAARLPDWLRQRISLTDDVMRMKHLLHEKRLHTVCQSASCPNISHCFKNHTATFMILGNVCTRHCRFCGITQGVPERVDSKEPERVAEAALQMKLKHVVVTSVTRDDLPDGGAFQFACVVESVKRLIPDSSIELLIPDFQGSKPALQTVLNSRPDVLNHNVETVPRLYPQIRPEADLERSLTLLRRARKQPGIITKSGFMLGLGETREEVLKLLSMLREVDCDALTIGQYLAPSLDKAPVREYVHPDVFKQWEEQAKSIGFPYVQAGPYVRSSFHAEAMIPLRGVHH